MTLARVRAVVLAVFVLGIGGMVAGSIADSDAFAMTSGLVTAVAALLLIVSTAVAKGQTVHFDEAAAARLEGQIDRLVADGTDEHRLRDLVRDAVALGRGSRH